MQAVYQIRNTITGDLYIGSAVDYSYRKWVHLHRLRKGTHHSAILQNSWNKHGESVFEFLILEEVKNKKELIQREQHYIDTLNPRYNIAKKAGSPLGTKHTYEARMNMRIAHLGIKLKPETIAKRTASVLGSKRSKKTIARMRVAAKNKRAVIQCDIAGVKINEWESSREASRKTKTNQSHITMCCKEKRPTAGGFKWKYK